MGDGLAGWGQVPESGSDAAGKGGWGRGAVQSQERKGESKHGTGRALRACWRGWDTQGEQEVGWLGQSRQRVGAHRHLLVGFHAIQHHLDDLPAQLDALL